MNQRALLIALAVSATLNVFAVAAGTTLIVSREKVVQRVEAENNRPRPGSAMQLVETIAAAEQDRVRTALRASAMAAKPDFEEARAARREAIALASGPDYQPAQVQALLERSRAAEMRGRARLEGDALQILATLTPEDRQIMAQILSRRKREHAAPSGPNDRPREANLAR